MFVLNGYEDLDAFREMQECELDYLGITDAEQRSNIMTAIELLQDYTCKLKLLKMIWLHYIHKLYIIG